MPTAWPSTLPDFCQIAGLLIKPVNNSIPMDLDSGPPMTRRRFTGDMESLQGSFLLIPRLQMLAVRDFWRTTLKDGSLPFTAEHPMTLVANTIFLFLVQPEAVRSGHLYNVSISVRKMPP